MNSDRNPARIAIVGLGYIGRAHAHAIRHEPQAALAAVVDPSDDAAGFADSLSIAHYHTLSAMFASERLDGVIVATPNTLHLSHARVCLDAGVPLLLEKPVAATVDEAREILKFAATHASVPILVGHHRAHSPIMQSAQELIAEGTLGRLVCVSGSATFYKPDEYFADGPWRCKLGGGPILLNLIHEIHNLRMLCGEISSVQALASNATRNFEVEDTVAISLSFTNGALGTFLLSDTAASARSWEQTSRENPAYARRDDEDCYVVSGTRGSLAIPTMRLTFYEDETEPSWWKPFATDTPARPEGDPIARQLTHFVDVVRRKVDPKVSLEDGIANLVVTEAIAEAAASGVVQRL